MNFKFFLALIILGTIIALASFVLVIFYFDPTQIGFAGFALFYLTLFLALSGVIFLISDSLKAKFNKKLLLYQRLRTSVRHAIFFSLLITGWAFLKASGLLRWWNLLLFILILTLLEFFFISTQKQKNTYPGSENSNVN